MKNVTKILVLGLLSGALVFAGTTPAAAQDFRETITANAVAMGTSNPPVIPRGVRLNLQINITRWSTEEEREEIFDVVRQSREGDQEALRQKLQGMDEVGWVRAINTRAVGNGRNLPREALRFSREYLNEDGSHRLILATDRPITFGEAQRRGRSWDFGTTLIILDLDDDGEGEGQLAMGAQLWFDESDGHLVINNFGSEPVRLLNVRRR
jgi:hypothetical protein